MLLTEDQRRDHVGGTLLLPHLPRSPDAGKAGANGSRKEEEFQFLPEQGGCRFVPLGRWVRRFR